MTVFADWVPQHRVTDWARITARELQRRIHSVVSPSNEREFICSSCGLRCTAGKNDGTEYGHATDRTGGKSRCVLRPTAVDSKGR